MAILSEEDRKRLIDALGESQRIGMLGDGSLDAAIDQALGFADAIPAEVGSFVDLGAGGGLPGLVVAVARKDLTGTLVDRRGKRVDQLSRLIGRLGLQDRIEAVEADVADLGVGGHRWPVALSRGFGSPEYTARHAVSVLVPGGRLLVSEPPLSTGERWTTAEVAAAGLEFERIDQGIATLRRV